MRDMGLVKFDEPMTMLRNQGIILGEDSEKMSKSRGNVIAPDEWVERYGADTMRSYLMFGWRWEQGGPWNSHGIEGIYRWLHRLWSLVVEPGKGVQLNAPTVASEKEIADLSRWTHKTIKRVTDDMEAFTFNTIIAGLMEFTNALQKAKATPVYGTEAWEEAIATLLLLLAPCCPHIAEELWTRTGRPYSVHRQAWPRFDAALAAEEMITLVVQINGKVRARIEVPADVAEEAAREAALADENVRRHLEGKPPRKVIVVPGKLVNIVA
jgi:leucyl-tRNA synthetase